MVSVPQIPSYEEFYGLIDNELTDAEFDVDIDDEKIKEMVAIALSLLQEFYITHMYDSEFYIVTNEFKKDVDNLNSRMKDLVLSLFSTYISSVQNDLDVKYVIPTGVVAASLELESVVNSGVNKVITQLYSEIKNKADFYRDVVKTTGRFSLHADFRRAIKRLTNVVDYNAQYSKNVVDRSYLEFVYGQEALFYWRVAGRNTCAWCYEMESMGAMPLSYFPVDHPNGHCWLEPVLSDVYSDEYIEIRGW